MEISLEEIAKMTGMTVDEVKNEEIELGMEPLEEVTGTYKLDLQKLKNNVKSRVDLYFPNPLDVMVCFFAGLRLFNYYMLLKESS